MLSTESILHYIWKYKLFSIKNLNSTHQQEIKILSSGLHNHDAGPDFLNAKVEIEGTIWAGNVEIHIKSSDWLKHQHQKDKAYDNVILHVVWEYDAEIKRTDNTLIPTIELKRLVQSSVINNYEELRQNNYWIPCEKQISFVDEFTKQQCLDRMLIERLEYKSQVLNELLNQQKGSWEDTFYITLAKSFGFKVNSLPFELLAQHLPQIILAKHKDSEMHIEALIFGISGLLNRKFTDEYPNTLKKEFDFLKQKYVLKDIAPELWKFSKTRPDNFPTIRLAQFAALVISSEHLFSKIIDIENFKDLYYFFKNLPINKYWENHYRFDQETNCKSAALGEFSIDIILINAIVPLLFLYGKSLGDKKYSDKALYILESIKPEHNKITKGFKERGFNLYDAQNSQAIIHLKKYFCDEKKCLNCVIGLKILRPKMI